MDSRDDTDTSPTDPDAADGHVEPAGEGAAGSGDDGLVDRLRPPASDDVLLVALVVAAVLRLFALGRESLWMDEVYSVTDALRFTTVELLTVLPVVKNHGPAYYVLLRHWAHATGLEEATLRLPSALAGIATVYVVYLVGRELFDARAGALAALLVAVSRYHVSPSQAVRMYAFVALLTAVSFYFLVRLADAYARRSVAGYVLATALLVYTHPYGVFLVLAQNLYVWGRLAVDADLAHTVRRWVAVQAGLGVLLAPYAVVLLHRLVSTASGTYTPLGWRVPPGPAILLGTVVRYAGYPIHPVSLLVVLPLLGGLVALVAVRVQGDADDPLGERLSLRETDREAVLLSLSWLLVPIAVPAALSYVLSPIYGVRYTVGASLALFLLVGRGLTRVRRRHLRVALVVVLLVGLAVPLTWYYGQPQNEEWDEATTYVADHAEAGDLVLFTDGDGHKPWDVYVSRPDLDTRSVPNDSAWRRVEDDLSRYETIWVLNRTHASTNDNRAAAVVLDDTHRLTSQRSYYGVDVYRFERRTNESGS